ncbi:MAG: hypothetical protein JST00_18555 [Deltaproteobacteria bacterium]|nr:hypothetical protein [Deltaproteobacteria bacterium]
MVTPTLAAAFEATVLFSTAASLLVSFLGRSQEGAGAHGRPPRALATLFGHPLAQLGLVCLLLWVNQVLFSAYVLRAHHGSVSFVARYVGAGWFAIDAHSPIVRFVASHVGDGSALAPSVLRVQAFLELPFTLFAYLAVARLLGSGLYRRLTSLGALYVASITWSVTFSIVEVALTNPYTNDDLALRALAAFVVPLYAAWISRGSLPAEDDGPKGLLGLLTFLAGAGALAYIVLAVYDAFLLYNLAHLARYRHGLVAATLVATAAAAVGARIDGWVAKARGGHAGAPSPSTDLCVSALRTFTLVFFAPSLAIRYRGHLAYAVLAGLLLVGLALAVGAAGAVRRILASADRGAVGAIVTLVVSGAAAGIAGAWAAWASYLASPHAVTPELVLARVALSFLVAAIVTFRAVEIAVCWARHEAKAQADEA